MNVKCFSLLAGRVCGHMLRDLGACCGPDPILTVIPGWIRSPPLPPTHSFLTQSAPTIGDTSLKPGTSTGSINDGRGTYNGATFALGVNQAITTTIKFARGAVTGTGTPIVQLGFGTAATGSFDNGGAGTALYSRALATALGSGVGVTPVVQPTSAWSPTTSRPALARQANPPASPASLWTIPAVIRFTSTASPLTRTGTSTFTQSVSIKLLDTDKVTPAQHDRLVYVGHADERAGRRRPPMPHAVTPAFAPPRRRATSVWMITRFPTSPPFPNRQHSACSVSAV